MANIRAKESMRQAVHGAKTFTKREQPVEVNGKRYLVQGGYLMTQDGPRYMSPRQICKLYGIDPAVALLWHPGDAAIPSARGMILVTAEGQAPGVVE